MHSPFGNPSVCVGDPQTQGALQDAPYLNSLHLNGVVLDETFDTVIPSAPSLDK